MTCIKLLHKLSITANPLITSLFLTVYQQTMNMSVYMVKTPTYKLSHTIC